AQNQNKSVTLNISGAQDIGLFTMGFGARDQVGNWSFTSRNVWIDFTTPSITAIENIPYAPGVTGVNFPGQFSINTRNLLITFNGDDGLSGSGIRRYWFKVVNERTGARIYPTTTEWQGVTVPSPNFPLLQVVLGTTGSTNGLPAL